MGGSFFFLTVSRNFCNNSAVYNIKHFGRLVSQYGGVLCKMALMAGGIDKFCVKLLARLSPRIQDNGYN